MRPGPISTDLARTDEYGVTRKELNRLIDDLHDWVFDTQEARGVRAIRLHVEVDPEREAGQ